MAVLVVGALDSRGTARSMFSDVFRAIEAVPGLPNAVEWLAVVIFQQ